jgi:2,3-bisphosphoglycerate-independent phosphoglycerate mutase
MATDVRRPLVLAVMDGWGLGPDGPFNAVTRAGLKNIPRWMDTYPWRPLQASGHAVGLPEGQMGNSEVGHLTLGAGRVILQDLPRISRSIEDGSFFENEVLIGACKASRNKTLHFMGLFSDGGVHSHIKHLKALLHLAKQQGVERVAVHAIMDGRDTSPTAGAGYVEDFLAFVSELGTGALATLVGRYYAMDRDKRWERIRLAYRAYTLGEGDHQGDPVAALRDRYEKNETDEFIRPIILPCPYGTIRDGDGIVFYNFRADRARQISMAFGEDSFEGFDREVRPKLSVYATMTRYRKSFSFPVAFEQKIPTNTFGEVLSTAGMNQLRIAETEKYAHVTFFFNGGREQLFSGEDRVLIPSPKVATYDLQPAMSAPKITEALLERLETGRYDFVLLNFANPDMVGHTGDFDAVCEAARTVDGCMGQVVEKVMSMGGAVALTADHGNLECMREPDGVHIHTAHTCNPVPFIWISGEEVDLDTGGERGLASIAPTLLRWLDLAIPSEMDAPPLIQGA